MLFRSIPNCKAYDPAFAGEMAVIIDRGAREMLVEQQDVFYYVTLMNENYAQPDLPAKAHEGVLRGCYKYSSCLRNIDGASGNNMPLNSTKNISLMGSGAILTEVIKAAQILTEQGFNVDVISVTSWSELARDGIRCETTGETPWLEQVLGNSKAKPQDARQDGSPHYVIAATDYVRAVPEQVRTYLPRGCQYTTLGTDGFGRSDTRAALRNYFNVDAAAIVKSTLQQLDSAAQKSN